MNGSNGSQHSELAVAIVGIAGRFPGADTVDELWSNLVNGVESIRRFPPGLIGWASPETVRRG
jgi:acyl transferase domain-containing protein